MTRIFGEKNCATFDQKMQFRNWNKIYNDTGEETYDKFISAVQNIHQQAFPLVRVFCKRWRDKPWLTKALKVSIKQNTTNSIGNIFCIQMVFIKQNIMLTKIVYANVSKRQKHELFENTKDTVFTLWKTLNPIINPSKTTTRTIINKLVNEGKRITNKQEISDTMNKYF